MKVGSEIGSSIFKWKAKTRPASRIALVVSKIGGLIGSAIEIIAVIGLIVGGVKEPSFWQMVGLFAVGLVIDTGSHWLAVQIDKKLLAK